MFTSNLRTCRARAAMTGALVGAQVRPSSARVMKLPASTCRCHWNLAVN